MKTRNAWILAAAAAFAPAALAQDADDMAQMQAIARAAGLIPPEQAMEKALAARPGTIVDADVDRKFRKHYYEVEIVDAQGVEWEVDIDAKTGEVRRVKKDWFD
ncbi:MAG TPA: PepSY domain-containing protein [Burkholderiales bacterium]|jgi:uncharacterized membrane protein YkoI|nr:PepSY domain-containing protein [Burkholderiales bacterium]